MRSRGAATLVKWSEVTNPRRQLQNTKGSWSSACHGPRSLDYEPQPLPGPGHNGRRGGLCPADSASAVLVELLSHRGAGPVRWGLLRGSSAGVPGAVGCSLCERSVSRWPVLGDTRGLWAFPLVRPPRALAAVSSLPRFDRPRHPGRVDPVLPDHQLRLLGS